MAVMFSWRILAFCLCLSLCGGCASVAGANNSKSHILYEHRTPIEKTAIIQAAQHGLLAQAGLNTDKVLDNAGEVSLGVAEIVKAVTKSGGFPFVIIPNLIKGSFSGIAEIKEENADQEVSKMYYVDGMKSLKSKLPDGAVFEMEFSKNKI